ncbi:energy transducer TonB [Alishewanella sp. d11]|uniref:energy transducer TonB n=1 Tax=Alishewanella sp. d11 TaxID=3414030 RepID=UPI003BF84CFB
MFANHYVNQNTLIPQFLRLLSSALLASLITFALFSLMKLLVTPAHDRLIVDKREFPIVELFIPPEETEPEIRRELPPKPDLIPPKMTLNHQDPVDSSQNTITHTFTPDLGIALQGPNLNTGMQNTMATPIVRVEPRFPLEAARQGISGWVKLAYSIDETGSVIDISIIEAEPKNIFDKEAIRALRRWKYQPQLVEGQPVKQTNLQVQLDFQLQQD